MDPARGPPWTLTSRQPQAATATCMEKEKRGCRRWDRLHRHGLYRLWDTTLQLFPFINRPCLLQETNRASVPSRHLCSPATPGTLRSRHSSPPPPERHGTSYTYDWSPLRIHWKQKTQFWFTIVWRGSRELSALGVSEAVGRVGSLAAHQLRPGVALPARPGRLATLLSDSRLR